MLSLGESVFASEHGGAADAAAHVSEQVLLRGFLLKRGAVVENWKRRFCSLTRTQAGIFKLTYAEAENAAPIDMIPLLSASRVVELGTERVDGVAAPLHWFRLVCRDRIWEFLADTVEARATWMDALTGCLRRPNRFTVRRQGALRKEGGMVKSWKQRWFAVGHDHLFYFEDRATFEQFAALAGDAVELIPEAVTKLALGIVPLVPAKSIGLAGIEGVYQGNDFTFQVDTGGRVYYMVAASHADMEDWIRHCRDGHLSREKPDAAQRPSSEC